MEEFLPSNKTVQALEISGLAREVISASESQSSRYYVLDVMLYTLYSGDISSRKPELVALILAHLRGQDDHPLPHFKDSCLLTQKRLVTKMQEILKRAGVDCQKYSGRSFQIGAATTAAC